MSNDTKDAAKKPAQRQPPKHITVFFDVRDGSYWYELNGRFVALKKSDLMMHLRADGLRDDIYFDGQRELDWPLYRAQIERMIDYAGDLAGHKAGTFTDGSGRKYLVTGQANGVFEKLEKQAAPEFFTEFLEELLPEDQCVKLCYWLAISLRSLRKGDFRPGQAVVFAGPAGCGKSLLQSIITEIFGGRSASPFRYLMDLTQFNKDLCAAEHWQIEDPATTTDIRTRRQFGNKLKESIVNRDFSIHAKGKDALTLPLFRRVTMSVNDEPENLAVIPPLDDSILGKLFLFKCHHAKKCFERFRNKSGEIERSQVWQTIMAEVPSIRAWLINTFKKVPNQFCKTEEGERFLIDAWHHPELRAELVSLAPETRLLQLIDDALFHGDGPHGEWRGKSSDLEKELRKSDVAFEVEKILRFVGAAGSYLGRLAKSRHDRVSKRVSAGYATWTIQPPAQESEK